MSFEPTIIIRKKHLDDNIDIFEDDQYSEDQYTKRVAEYLVKVYKEHRIIKFDDLELLICSPEFSSFNQAVRDRLVELNIEYEINY